MSVPIFNPEGWALLYFSMPGSPYPQTPDEVFVKDYKRVREVGSAEALGYTVVSQRVHKIFVVDSAGNFEAFEFGCDAGELIVALTNALNSSLAQGAGRLFTIHQSSMIERLLHWRDLRARLMLEVPILPRVPAMIDIVDKFNYPAIISLDQRRAFSTVQVRLWLGMNQPAEENEATERRTLTNLCQIL